MAAPCAGGVVWACATEGEIAITDRATAIDAMADALDRLVVDGVAHNQPLLAAHASECRAETDFRRAPGSPPRTLARWGG